jgi:hypothetical protein
MRKILGTLLLLPALCQAAPTAKAYALTNGTTTHRNVATAFASRHSITVTNDQPSPKIFDVTLSLCHNETNRCRKEVYHIALAKGQTLTREYLLHITLMFPRVGTKTLTATTQVTGAANAIASDDKWVEVFF